MNKKVTFKKIVLFSAFFFLGLGSFAQSYSGGSGTPTDPFQIATKADLKYLSENPSEWSLHFLQIANIQFTSTDYEAGGLFYNSGEFFSPIGNVSTFFSGSYNGQGYIIDSLKIARPTQNFIGFFGTLDEIASITECGITNFSIQSSEYAGGLVGYNSYGTISNCYATGTVNEISSLGGLVGYSFYGNISMCYANSVVNGTSDLGGLVGYSRNGAISLSYATGYLSGGGSKQGGLVGYNRFGTISNCYAKVAVIGNNTVGGLVGYNTGTISKSYSLGLVSGNVDAGGLVGSSSDVLYTTNSFWDTLTSNQNISGGGTGKTTIEMQAQSTFTDSIWDFVGETTNGNDDFWKMGCGSNNGYPILSWQERDSINPSLVASISVSGASTFCESGSVALNSTIGNTYLWSNGETTQVINVENTDTLTVQITDTNGCTSLPSNEIIVTENPLPVTPTISAVSATAFCAGGSVVLNSTIGNAYLWSNGETTQDITVESTDTLTVQVTDANGCTSLESNEIIVTENPLPVTPTITAASATTFCEGGSVVLSSSSGANYVWNTGETSATVTVDINDTLSVQITDANGCTSASSNVIIVTVLDCASLVELSSQVSIAPNPTTGKITISFEEAFAQVSVMNAQGKVVVFTTMNSETTLDISSYQAGVYIVRIATEKGTFLKRLVKN